ncbi:MAG TPA: hypothetical protein VGE34_03500 [Candidatus Saccharimonadales bacterium]
MSDLLNVVPGHKKRKLDREIIHLYQVDEVMKDQEVKSLALAATFSEVDVDKLANRLNTAAERLDISPEVLHEALLKLEPTLAEPNVYVSHPDQDDLV